MIKFFEVVFGASWKSSLIGLLSAIVLAVVTYAQARPEPGWYIVAFALAALGRVIKDWDKSNAPSPLAEATKVPPKP